MGYKSFFVHNVKQYFLVCGDVQPRVTYEVVDKAPFFNLIVAVPSFPFRVVILYKLKEKDGCRTFNHKSAFVEKIHWAKVFVRDLVHKHIMDVSFANCVRKSLSVKQVDLEVMIVVEALNGKVLL